MLKARKSERMRTGALGITVSDAVPVSMPEESATDERTTPQPFQANPRHVYII
jgi:hypothetical protein